MNVHQSFFCVCVFNTGEAHNFSVEHIFGHSVSKWSHVNKHGIHVFCIFGYWKKRHIFTVYSPGLIFGFKPINNSIALPDTVTIPGFHSVDLYYNIISYCSLFWTLLKYILKMFGLLILWLKYIISSIKPY